MIRPEDIAIGPAPTGKFISMKAALRERIFIGDAVRIHATLDSGDEIVAQPPPAALDALPAVGQPIELHWHADKSRHLDA